MYRSRFARQPQYKVISLLSPRCRALSHIALIGAKPVPLATMTIGLSDSSRRKNVPSGPSKRSRSRTFRVLKTWSVKAPPGVWRTWSSSAVTPSGRGGLAIE